jgi:hypothetical protein
MSHASLANPCSHFLGLALVLSALSGMAAADVIGDSSGLPRARSSHRSAARHSSREHAHPFGDDAGAASQRGSRHPRADPIPSPVRVAV